ncbi:MAG: alpha/beta fold hydrolase [Anaerolineales bacterium]|nr:alpha/beta fold hydrolase [Anaerolineales bacterium]
MSALIIDDELVHYEVLGRGRPVIFVHGWLGSWRYWIPTMQAASAEYRAYALDLWGFGDTAKAAPRYTLDAQAELLARFMDQLGILKAAFVGHGLGGAVLLRLAHQHPDLADRAMSVCLPLTSAAVSARLLSGSAVSLIEWLLGKGPAVEPISREAAKADPAAVEQTVRAVMETEQRGQLAELKPAVLLVHGEKDPMIAPPDEAALAGLNGNVHSLGLEDSRHFPMLDEAAKFNRLLTDFLAVKSGESLSNLGLKDEWKRRIR